MPAPRSAPGRPIQRDDESVTASDEPPGDGDIPSDVSRGDVSRAAAPFSPGRRRFLAWLSVGLGGIAAGVAGVPFIGFLFSRDRAEEEVWRPVARADELEIGSTVKVAFADPAPLPWAGEAGRSAAWLRREDDADFIAFSIYCTHTGCPVQWEEGAQLFLCPCHGGVFYRDGQVAAGPPPTPLERHPLRIRDGVIELRTIGVQVPGA